MNILALIDVLFFTVVFSPVCIFIHVVFTWEGMLAYEVGQFLDAILPSWIAKPLFNCPTCMASIWGTLFWFTTGGSLSLWWVVACMALSGYNTIASQLIYSCKDEDGE